MFSSFFLLSELRRTKGCYFGEEACSSSREASSGLQIDHHHTGAACQGKGPGCSAGRRSDFCLDTRVPLTRMQTEAEQTAKSARAKSLVAALSVAASAEGVAGAAEGEQVASFGFQAAQKEKAKNAGVNITKKPKKAAANTDKSLRDIFKLGSHILK